MLLKLYLVSVNAPRICWVNIFSSPLISTLFPPQGLTFLPPLENLPSASRITLKKFLLSFVLLEVLTTSLLADTSLDVRLWDFCTMGFMFSDG